MFLSVGASTEAKALHVCSVGSVSTRHAVVCVFLAFMKNTISPLILVGLAERARRRGRAGAALEVALHVMPRPQPAVSPGRSALAGQEQ